MADDRAAAFCVVVGGTALMQEHFEFGYFSYAYRFWLGHTINVLLALVFFPWQVLDTLPQRKWRLSPLSGVAALFQSVVFVEIGFAWTIEQAYVGVWKITGLPFALSQKLLVLSKFIKIAAFGGLGVIASLVIVCYDLGKCCCELPFTPGEGGRKARTSLRGLLGLLLRWLIIMPFVGFVEYRSGQDLLLAWPHVEKIIPQLPTLLAQAIQPGCAVTHWAFMLGTWQVWLAFMSSLVLGVYLAPRQWLRHLWQRRWETARRLTPLALVQGIAALYLLLPWPLTFAYRFISRVTCDSRFLVPPEPWRSVFAVLNGAVFGVSISVLGLLALQCYDEGRCRLGIEVAFVRLRPGVGRVQAQRSRWGRWLYGLRRWVARPLLLGAGLWGGWQIGHMLLSALWAWLR